MSRYLDRLRKEIIDAEKRSVINPAEPTFMYYLDAWLYCRQRGIPFLPQRISVAEGWKLNTSLV